MTKAELVEIVAEEAGIPIVFSAPLVRSSYHAREVFSQV